jgi:hypothetical protein
MIFSSTYNTEYKKLQLSITKDGKTERKEAAIPGKKRVSESIARALKLIPAIIIINNRPCNPVVGTATRNAASLLLLGFGFNGFFSLSLDLNLVLLFLFHLGQKDLKHTVVVSRRDLASVYFPGLDALPFENILSPWPLPICDFSLEQRRCTIADSSMNAISIGL